MKVTTMLGEELDIGAIMAQNPATVAVGNASMNARGDIIDTSGNVIKAREQIAMDYYDSNPQQAKSVGLRQLTGEMFLSPAEALEKTRARVAAPVAPVPALVPTPPTPPSRKRKLIDDEDSHM